MGKVGKIHVNCSLSQGFLPVAPQKSFGAKTAVIHENQMYAAALDENDTLWVSRPRNGRNTGCTLQKTEYAAAETEFLHTADGEVLHFISVQSDVFVQRNLEKDTDALPDFQRLDIPAPAPGAFVERICAAEYTSGSESEILLAVYFKAQEGYQITLVYWDRNGTPGCMSSGVTTKILDGGWYINGDTILFCALDSTGTHACLFDLDSGVAASLPLPRAAKNTAWYSRDGQLCGVLLDMDGRLLHVTKEDSEFITAPLFANEGSNQQICNLDEIKLQQVGPSVHLWGRAGTSLWHFSDLQKSDNQPGELMIVAKGIQDFSTCPGTDAGYVLTACAANGLENGSDLTMYRVTSDSGRTARAGRTLSIPFRR